MKDTAKKLEKGIIAFSPLAQGLLTDRYLKGIPEDSRIMTDGRFLKKSALTEEKLVKIRETYGSRQYEEEYRAALDKTVHYIRQNIYITELRKMS